MAHSIHYRDYLRNVSLIEHKVSYNRLVPEVSFDSEGKLIPYKATHVYLKNLDVFRLVKTHIQSRFMEQFRVVIPLAAYLILFGFLLNAAVPPLHAWLPDAYAEGTFNGSIFLSAFTTKTAVYVLARTFPGDAVLEGLPVVVRLIDPPLHEFLPNEEQDILAVARELGSEVAEVRARHGDGAGGRPGGRGGAPGGGGRDAPGRLARPQSRYACR